MDNTQREQLPRVQVAVIISDIHFDLGTIHLATSALKEAIAASNSLKLPLVIAGDTHNSKAIIRGECIKTIMDCVDLCDKKPYVLVANHDRINERSPEHSLEFLRNTAHLITAPITIQLSGKTLWFIPYQHDANEMRRILKSIPKGSTIIMHQGLTGSLAGEYTHDKSAITYDDVKDFRVISGHYHTRQDIKTGRPQKGAVGMFSYVGNPYTLSFGEANDPPKGFQILMDDGTLEFVPTNLRKHVVIEVNLSDETTTSKNYGPQDLLWVKVKGTKEQIAAFDKTKLGINQAFRLDLIPIDAPIEIHSNQGKFTSGEVLDQLIESLDDTSPDRKTRLKELWRNSASN